MSGCQGHRTTPPAAHPAGIPQGIKHRWSVLTEPDACVSEGVLGPAFAPSSVLPDHPLCPALGHWGDIAEAAAREGGFADPPLPPGRAGATQASLVRPLPATSAPARAAPELSQQSPGKGRVSRVQCGRVPAGGSTVGCAEGNSKGVVETTRAGEGWCAKGMAGSGWREAGRLSSRLGTRQQHQLGSSSPWEAGIACSRAPPRGNMEEGQAVEEQNPHPPGSVWQGAPQCVKACSSGVPESIWGSSLGDPPLWAQQLYPTWGPLLLGGSLLVLSDGFGAPSP